jgi:signal transduction histidine kinase
MTPTRAVDMAQLARVVHIASLTILALAIAAALFARVGGTDVPDPFTVFLATAGVGYATLGRTVVTRTGNLIGWVFLGMGTAAAIGIPAEAYLDASYRDPDTSTLPLTELAGWLTNLMPALFALAYPMLFLLFPSGTPPTPRWRWVGWTWLVGSGLSFVWLAFRPGEIYGEPGRFSITNPFGVSFLADVGWLFLNIGGAAVLTATAASIVSLIVRFRRAKGDERQQIRWLLLVGVVAISLFVVVNALAAIIPDGTIGDELVEDALWTPFVLLLVFGPPVATAIAIFRYHLYDVDLVIKKAVIFAILVVLLTGAFVITAAAVGTFVGRSTGSDVAVAFILGSMLVPAWRLSRWIADRLVYGGRAAPGEVLSGFADRLSETYAVDDVLPRMAAVMGEATRAAEVRVWVRVGREFHERAAWPSGVAHEPAVAGDSDRLPTFPRAAHATEIRDRGELLGAVTVQLPANDPIDASRAQLVRDLASQAGLVLRNVRLIEELRASRQRLVAAQDEERRKLERNIHDGVQQQLVALNVQLGLLASSAGRDPDGVATMARTMQEQTMTTLEDLRDLARGIYPPLLADRGLAAALEAQARKAPVSTRLESDGTGRYPRDVEAAVYFSCLEALNNVVKYAGARRVEISIGERQGMLAFRVTDDGMGFDPGITSYGTGLQGIADRLDAIGGTLEVHSAPGSGTSVTGTVPIARAETSSA